MQILPYFIFQKLEIQVLQFSNCFSYDQNLTKQNISSARSLLAGKPLAPAAGPSILWFPWEAVALKPTQCFISPLIPFTHQTYKAETWCCVYENVNPTEIQQDMCLLAGDSIEKEEIKHQQRNGERNGRVQRQRSQEKEKNEEGLLQVMVGAKGCITHGVHRNIKDFLYDSSIQFYYILPRSNILNQSCFIMKVICHNLGKICVQLIRCSHKCMLSKGAKYIVLWCQESVAIISLNLPHLTNKVIILQLSIR